MKETLLPSRRFTFVRMLLTLILCSLLCLLQMPAASAQATSSSTDKAVRSTLETVGVKLDQPAVDVPASDTPAVDLQRKRAAAEKEKKNKQKK